MLLLRPPGVYQPQSDSLLLARTALAHKSSCAAREGRRPRVLDLCTGTGVLALAAARAGADVTAVDISRRAVLAARCNAALHGVPLRVLRGDLAAPVAAERFDLVLANPPYVVRLAGRPGHHSRARAWDAGPDGRELVDRICGAAPALLARGGALVMVHSGLCGVGATLRLLRDGGLRADVAARSDEPFGPVMSARAAGLAGRGLIERDQRSEELVVIRAERVV
ncbi:HemK2/MTQ2 family protein methyltransferase [Streptomyces sp. ICBB 8177]|uniref:HemK2/MTQ2 family protein methyltransferase n=1 Tax=Streptomyces sp. ICBB 8177 TaxID=563922 RepID=UPI000D67636C|nr:HemK2/MTQ2 family protein methyltransferase [Streptomyces sp. ICBB 8177]PWI42921.1 methyltransferase [Streptomyces sp. ICBB 8177]